MAEAAEYTRHHGAAEQMALPTADRLRIFAAELRVAGGDHQHAVNVWAEAAGGGETRTAIATLSPEHPAAVVPRVTLRGEFVLRHDYADATVSLYCQIVCDGDTAAAVDAPAASRLVEPTVIDGVELEPLDDDDDYPEAELCDSDDDDEGEIAHLHVVDIGPPRDGKEDEFGDGVYRPVVEYELPSEEDEAERYDSDNDEEYEDGGAGEEEDAPPRKVTDGQERSSKRGSVPLSAVPAGIVVPDGDLLGPARYAAVENTAGFMRVFAAAGGVGQNDEVNREITVLYRYTRFSRTWSGRRGVEACRRTKLHRLRFAVPRAGDVASSLAWAGSALGPLVYPAMFRRELHDLWSTLSAAPAVCSTIPPGAARVQVIVDVGILRRGDHTPERMDHMRAAMEAGMREAWPELYHVGMDLQLPEPVPDNVAEQGGDDGTRTAKRRKTVNDEDNACALCFDPLERGLAAWPGCRHVFHGACVEKTLAGSEMCPLCRTKLSDKLVP